MIIRSLDALQQHLNALAPPAAGFRRVYRGQNRDFGRMIPSGIRRRTREYWSLWHRHVMLVAPFESDLAAARAQGVPSTLDMISFWVHAIAQHYGGDSNYLDVTSDVQSALWFALHQMVEKRGTIVLGPGTAPDPVHDVSVRQTFWKYERWQEPAWLYVFDVPPWNGESWLSHGTLIDVAAQAPQLVSDSTRMTVQRASLLYADSDVGDLTSFYACPPLQVAWPMEGADRLTLGTMDVFPPPHIDEWYARFLRQPLTIAPIAASASPTDDVQFERPIPVAMYLYDSPEGRNDMVARLTLEHPPLASKGIRELMVDGGASASLVGQLDSATVILCEAALQALLPTHQDYAWHTTLLLSDLPASADALHLGTGEAAGPIDLTNVIFEFSPLEGIAVASARRVAAADYVRGLWVMRGASDLQVVPFIQQANGPGVTISPLRVVEDPTDACGLAFMAGDARLPSDACRFLVAPVRAALFTLRSLASGAKILPYVLAAIDQGLPSGTFLAGVDHATTVPCLTAKRPFGTTLHVLRQEGEAFLGPGKRTTKTFMVPASQPFRSIPLAELRGLATGAQQAPP